MRASVGVGLEVVGIKCFVLDCPSDKNEMISMSSVFTSLGK